MSLIERWKALGTAGIIVSICFGELPGHGLSFSVLACNAKNQECFEMPYAAESFEHAVEIAEIEARKRGWIDG